MHRTAAYSQEEIVRLVNNFAYAKTLATTSKMTEHHDLLISPWAVNRVSVGSEARSQAEFAGWIREEVRFAQARLKQAAAGGPKPFGLCLQSMHTATRKFFQAYGAMQAETAVIDENTANQMGLWARNAARVQMAANISLTWLGLLGGPATVGINWARRELIYKMGDVTGAFIGKKLAVGVFGAFGTVLVTDWSNALNADFAITQATNNAPSLVDDSWRLFFASLNDTAVGKLRSGFKASLETVAEKADAMYKPGMTVLGNPATEKAAVERAAAVKTAQNAEQQLANYKPQGTSTGMLLGKATMTVAAWGLTIYSTWDSWKQYQKVYKETEPTRAQPYN
jgi:hypothetical protein